MMKKVIAVILNLVIVLPLAMSQESEKSNFSIGFNIGGGQTENAYRLTPDKYNFTYSEGDLHFTSGVNLAYFITGRLRPRFEFRYSEMKYGMNWAEEYTDFTRTDTKLYTMNLNLNIDYLLLNKNKFQLFASPGLVSEFVAKAQHRNYRADGETNLKNYSVLTDQYPDEIAGAAFSFLFKYKMNNHVGFTLTPGYTYYFKNFVPDNDKKYTKTTLNFGLEYTF